MSWIKRNPIAMVIKRGADAIDSLVEAMETLLGQRGDPLDRVVTFRDLYTAGIAGMKDTSGAVRYWNGPVNIPLIPVEVSADLSGYPVVSAPATLVVDSTLSANILSWETPDTPRYAYTKVFRADSDNHGIATQVGASGGGFYYDLLGSGGIAKYYWIRHTDIDGLDTALNDTHGTLGTTGYLTDPDIEDGTIHGEKIQTGTLAADRVAAGTLSAAIAYTGEMTISSSGYLESSNYDAGVAGYRINATMAEFNNVTVRGALDGATGTLGTLTMGVGGFIESENYVSGTTGWRLSDTGAEFNSGGITVDYADIVGTKPPGDADNTSDSIEAGTTITAGGITLSGGGSIKGGQTDYHTGKGWYLGFGGGEYKFSIGDPTGNYFTWDGTGLAFVGSITNATPYTPGTYAECSSTGIVTGIATSYTTAKAISVSRSGTATFEFSARIQSGGAQGQARIYINGSAAGKYRTFGSALQTWSEDLTVSAGDLITVECRNSAVGSVWAVHSFTIYSGSPTGNAVAVI